LCQALSVLVWDLHGEFVEQLADGGKDRRGMCEFREHHQADGEERALPATAESIIDSCGQCSRASRGAQPDLVNLSDEQATEYRICSMITFVASMSGGAW